ncbi:hypothetical protein BDY19DRAFT_743655 [Irpex rosettiformis]|uniref:Uncharacterized protein n=1 Tax=Irpex rosettiformis TaxID=378272 RepID=A0ACB8U917_9APHY|nr:hypothetical protein BDY19DRAFT_743655 [Irpex rosettiformis]
MIFASSSDNSQKTAEHLVVFNHEHRRVLLPLPESYEAGILAAKGEFALPAASEVSFTTRELPGCDGEPVEIHQRTWATITPILAQIIVNVARSEQRLVSEAPTLPDEELVDSAPANKGKAKEITPSRDDQPAAVSKIRKRPSMVGHGNALLNGAPRKSMARPSISGNAETNTSRVSAAKPFTALPSSQIAASSSRTSSTPSPHTLHTHHEDEEDEEQVLRSPRKGKNARKRIMSDDELEYEEIEAPTSHSSEEVRSLLRSSSNGTIGRPSKTPQQSQVSPPVKRPRTPPRELATSTPSAVSRPAERIVNPAETCLITVDYDDGNEVCSSTFKTKGRHTVHKVLMTVCKTFGIEALYPRVNLVRVITDSTDDPDNEGQVIEQRFTCPREHTMTQVGAHDDARFAIDVVEDETDTA